MRTGTIATSIIAGVAGISSAYALVGSSGQFSNITVEGHVVEPQKLVPAYEALSQSIRVPEGFSVSIFASGLQNPRMMAVRDDGTVYVTRHEQGDVVMLKDTTGDGRANVFQTVARRPQMHGIAISGDRMYLVTVKDVYVADIREDGTLGELRQIVDDLPDGGQHSKRSIAVGPDGMLYITIGSTCNACVESNDEHAALLRVSPDGKSRIIYASGLRNMLGFAWHPATGELWGMDQGMDWLGNQYQSEELNHIQHGKQYGWPYIFDDGNFNPQDNPPGATTLEQWRDISTPPVLGYTAHASPMQMLFYTGNAFPQEYQGDAFVAMRGSWNRQPPSGYEVVRIRFENGKPAGFEPFLTGFLVQSGEQQFGYLGRPVGLAQLPDGLLLVGDDSNGMIYRVTHRDAGIAQRPTMGTGAAGGAPTQAAQTRSERLLPDSDLAIRLVSPKTDSKLQVTSASFGSDEPIPNVYSAYGEGMSPQLSWTGTPPETQSLVVIVDDMDATPAKPFTHWIIYNVPGSADGVEEGLPKHPVISNPIEAVQGRNTRGSIGWFGPKPPAEDGPHRYHFQVFALDQQLDIPPAASREQVLAAMEGHVLSTGELVATYDRQ